MVCSRSSAAWIASGVVTARPPRTRRAGGRERHRARPQPASRSPRARRREGVVARGLELDVRPGLGRGASGLASRDDEELEGAAHGGPRRTKGGEALGQPAGRQSTWAPSIWTARLASGKGKTSRREAGTGIGGAGTLQGMSAIPSSLIQTRRGRDRADRSRVHPPGRRSSSSSSTGGAIPPVDRAASHATGRELRRERAATDRNVLRVARLHGRWARTACSEAIAQPKPT